ncbi:hypothetical protein LTR78_001757 [Recurvomyces mirabilis]|uniref:Uncharacterized protein n=1 Tax=Recurvomyces mirabilis TaxID=574656 RepID=A0AAE0WVQ9_9PEZI|nr:hypothetical protein LTR78_001757 [Recurvomyces mirabilis]KAK5150168.1 hypothetical protein LTS14_010297 [Recurvomyces mirabilis]
MPHTDTEVLRPPQVLALPHFKSRCVLTIVTERRSYNSGNSNPYLQDEEEQLLVCKGYIEPTSSLNHSKDPVIGTGLRRPVTVKLYMPQHGHSSVRAFKDVAALSYALRRREGKSADIPEVLANVHKHPDGVDRSLRDVIGDFWPSVLHFVIFEFMPPENLCEDPGEIIMPPKNDMSYVGVGLHKTDPERLASPHTPKYDEDDDDDSLSFRSRDWVYTPSTYGSPPKRAIPTNLLNDDGGLEKTYKASVAICGTPLALTELDVSLT